MKLRLKGLEFVTWISPYLTYFTSRGIRHVPAEIEYGGNETEKDEH